MKLIIVWEDLWEIVSIPLVVFNCHSYVKEMVRMWAFVHIDAFVTGLIWHSFPKQIEMAQNFKSLPRKRSSSICTLIQQRCFNKYIVQTNRVQIKERWVLMQGRVRITLNTRLEFREPELQICCWTEQGSLIFSPVFPSLFICGSLNEQHTWSPAYCSRQLWGKQMEEASKRLLWYFSVLW